MSLTVLTLKNFRSTPAGPGNDAEVNAFMAGGVPGLRPEALHGMHDHGMQDMHMAHRMNGPALGAFGPRPFAGRSVGVAGGPMVASQDVNSSAAWASEFASFGSQPPNTLAAVPPPGALQHHHQQPLQAVNRLQHFSSGMHANTGPATFPTYTSFSPSFAPPIPILSDPVASVTNPNNNGPDAHLNASATHQSTAPTASATMGNATSMPAVRDGTAPSGIAGLTEAELEARFAQAEAEFDFQDEMDRWMSVHGPTAERNQTEDVDTILETMADELEAQKLADADATNEEPSPATIAEAAATTQVPAGDETDTAAAEATATDTAAADESREQDALAQTAGQIVSTLSAHPSARFQQSSFMHLMKRIEAREVTVVGDNFVDEQTGQPIEVEVRDASAAAAATANTNAQDEAAA